MKNDIYKIRLVRGAFINPKILDPYNPKVIEKVDRSEWISIDKVTISLESIIKLQKEMIRHFDNPNIPWYMDGYNVKDKDEILVAFGADDGNGGKIFNFKRNDTSSIDEVIKYGISKEIPKEQLDFLDIDF